jgi:spectinomycin phosphotransferase
MLHKPDLPDDALAACLSEAYALRAGEIAFLPLGADWHSAVYRVVADDGRPYLLKLRSGAFDDVGAAVARLLHDRGAAQVIPPIATTGGRLWTRVERFALVLYPFVEGEDDTRPLTDEQWRRLGDALRRIHAARLPAALTARIPREAFAPAWRDAVRGSLARVERERFADPVAAELAALLRAEHERVLALVDRTDALAEALRASPPPVTLCHGDWHRGNALVGRDGALRVFDWDTLVFAPRECDLSLIGAGWGGPREAGLFYEGYGTIEPDPVALAYYRHHRIIRDLAEDCAAVFDSSEGGASRAEALALASRTVGPGGRIDVVLSLGKRGTAGPPPQHDGAAGGAARGTRIRPVERGDVAACAAVERAAFGAASSPEASRRLIARLVGHPGVYGVVAERGGALVGLNFLYEHDPIRAVGPLAVAPAAQGRGVGRRLMEAVLARAAAAAGVRLTAAANPAAFALYASLGFEVKEPLAILRGRFRSAPPADAVVRPLREADLPAAAALCARVHGFARTGDLREALTTGGEPMALERAGRIVAYASHRRLGDRAHGVAEAEADLRALLLGLGPPGGAECTLFLPTRRAGLLRWCLAEGLRVGSHLTLMAKGAYRAPRGASFPSSWY